MAKKTTKISEVREQQQEIADAAKNVFDTTGDLKAAQIALKGYNGAVQAVKAQLIYKKLTGSPKKIAFLE